MLEANPDHPRKTRRSAHFFLPNLGPRFWWLFTSFSRSFYVFSPSFHGLFTLQTCLDSVKSPDDTHPDIVRNPDMLIILDRYMGVKQIATHGRALAPMHF